MKKIFIASNFVEFKDLRSILFTTLSKMHNFSPIDLNDQAADTRKTIERSLDNVKTADYFILLLGNNYGSIVEEYGYSHTHLEYLEALKHHKTILVYSKNDFNPEYLNTITNNDMYEFISKVKQNHTISTILINTSNTDEHTALMIKTHILETSLNQHQARVLFNLQTNKQNKISNNQFLITRNIEIDASYSFFPKSDHYSSKLLYITGNPGVGKSSFMIDMFQNINKHDEFNNFLYFIDNGSSIQEISESLYGYLYSYITNIFESKGINSNVLSSIHTHFTFYDRISTLFQIYSKQCIEHNLKQFILLIDNLDAIEIQEELFKRLIVPAHNFHFIVSARKNQVTNYLKQQQLEYDFFEVYGNLQDDYTLKLSNFNAEFTSRYVACNIDKEVNQADMEILINFIYEKSNGLPLYLKYLTVNLNQKIHAMDHVDMKIIENYLDSLPNELTDYYNMIFDDFSDKELQVLKILFWFDDPVSFYDLSLISEYKQVKEIIQNKLTILIDIFNNDTVVIAHSSIKEALFNKYNFENGVLVSNKISNEDMIQLLNNEDEVFKEIAGASSFINNFHGLNIYSANNSLYKTLEKIINVLLNSKINTTHAISLLYAYVKAHILQTNISISIADNSKFTDIFEKFKVDQSLDSLIAKFLSYYDINQINEMSKLQKLFAVVSLVNQPYFVANILKIMFGWKYKKLYDMFLSTSNYEYFDQIDYVILRDYIAKTAVLKNTLLKDKLVIYNDAAITSITQRGKITIESNLVNQIKKLYQSKKNRPPKEFYKRVYEYLRRSNNPNIFSALNKDISSFIINREKKNGPEKFKISEKLTEYDLKDLSNDINFNICKLTIKNGLKRNDYTFYTLPKDMQNTLTQLEKIVELYKRGGLDSILNSKNHDVINFYPNFIMENDFIHYWNYCLKYIQDTDLINISNEAIKATDNQEFLTSIESFYLSSGFSPSTHLDFFVKLYFKMNNLSKFNSLYKYVIDKCVEHQERKELSSMANNINSLKHDDEVIDLYLNYGNDTTFLPNRILNLTDIEEEVIFYYIDKLIKKNDTKSLNHYLHIFTSHLDNLNVCNSIINKYNEYYSGQWNLQLNISLKTNFNIFLTQIEQYALNIQIDYLYQNINYIRKSNKNIFITNEFIGYIFKVISSCNQTKETVYVIKSIYNQSNIIQFIKNNPHIIGQLYSSCLDTKNEYNLEFSKFVYILSLVILDEKKYVELFEKTWFKNSLLDSPIIMLFIYNFSQLQNALEFVQCIKIPFLQYRALWYLSIKFRNEFKCEDCFNNFKKHSSLNELTKSMFDNTIQYTIKNMLGENKDEISELLNSILIDDYNITKYNFQKLYQFINYDLYTEDSNEQINAKTSLDQKSILFSYLKYIRNNEIISVESFSTGNLQEIIKNLLVLIHQYKKAEQDANEILYEKCEITFSMIKNNLKESPLHESINKIFHNKFFTTSLEEVFDYYDFSNSDINEFHLSTILIDYSSFYSYLKTLYKNYKESKMNDDNELEFKCMKQFEEIRNEILNNEDYYQKLIYSSSITNKLQIKLTNIELLKPMI